MKFNGTNVRLLRVFREMTQLELSQEVSVSEAMIWQIERDRQPSESLLEALSLVLGVDTAFFFDVIKDEFDESECHFRKGGSSAERIRKRVLAQASLFGHVASYLANRLSLPKYDVPELTAVTAEEIERAAEHCRDHWKLGRDRPITKMGRVLENAGVMLTRLRNDDSVKLDAFSRRGRVGAMSFVVLNPAKRSSSRTRYDMAHELAHLVLDHDIQLPLAEREHRADRFAAAFLLPRAGVRREFHFARGVINWDHIFELKKRWKVSAQAILYRAYDLRLIDVLEFRRAYKTMSARGWVRKEPSEPENESPELFRKAMQTLWQRKKIGAAEVAKDLHWSVATFEDVTGLRSGSSGVGLRENASSVVSLSDHRRLRNA